MRSRPNDVELNRIAAEWADIEFMPVETRLLNTAPKPPDNFVARPTEYNALKRLLLAGGGNPVAITAALRGAGGYGKTTLAQALCHDPEIIAHFPDGILWTALGQKPG